MLRSRLLHLGDLPRGPAAVCMALAAGAFLMGLAGCETTTPVSSPADRRAAAEAGRAPNDPHYATRGGWGQPHDDQWALKRIGFTPRGDANSAWTRAGDTLSPVTVAVIDSGLDYYHPDLPPGRLWRNRRERLNGRDDDGNGYVDDMIGWNFVDRTPDPRDEVGHGTHVVGIIAAAAGNGEGIAGINPAARIMALKALDRSGRGRGLRIAEAIVYAAANGARVINLSLGGDGQSPVERAAIEHARRKGVLVVVAAGNGGVDAASNGLSGLANVITVAATDMADRRTRSSNWGNAVDLAAPGVDILSLRARGTEFQRVAGVLGSAPGAAVVGRGARYYRASGTSFAAAFVSGVASLLIARDPTLTPVQVKRILLSSARDIEAPGWDRLTGYGLLDASAALAVHREFRLQARLDRIELEMVAGEPSLQIYGAADADRLLRAWIEIAPGDRPTAWREVAEISQPAGLLARLPIATFGSSPTWTIRLIAEHHNGKRREARHVLTLRRPGAG